jgi:hypothetical protein
VVRWEDVQAQDAGVYSRVGLERDWGADPAPVESSVGPAFRQSVFPEAVRLVFRSAVSMADCRVVPVRHPATEQEEELAQPELVLLYAPPMQALLPRQAERR